ncbi:MAG: hypothetical protein ACLUQ2_02930 [Klebsiella pneumoniae]
MPLAARCSASAVAPLWLMALAPFIALLLVLHEAADPPAAGGTSRRGYRPYDAFLLLALLLAALVSLMQRFIAASSSVI